MCSSSSVESAFGSQTTPPLAPPNGRFVSAHFHVIHIARPLSSSSVTAGVVADAALRRAARDAVRDAPAGEDAHAAVVHRRRDRDLDRLLARAEDLDEVVVDAERVGHVLQLLLGHLQGRGAHPAPWILKVARDRVGLPPSTGHATRRSWYAPGASFVPVGPRPVMPNE